MLKENDKEILALKKNINITITYHVKMEELEFVQSKLDKIFVENQIHKEKIVEI